MNRSQEFGIGTNSPTPESDSSRNPLPRLFFLFLMSDIRDSEYTR